LTLARDLRDLSWLGGAWVAASIRAQRSDGGPFVGQWAALAAVAGLGQPRAQPGVATQLGGRREPTDVAHLGGDAEPSTQAIPGAVIPSDPATV
jgi:hypothetical protein